ncbi:TauD/TfdA family dioxygenase [Nocardioides terrigena]|uniref:TauD/TfdA family dioxygenase n=1 Tax=Nocardioides terrigena TaxID=424797 RepID=UPI000D327AC6|nr:TauD/TfdA family dioxygenase [Nocardioides terrigena]
MTTETRRLPVPRRELFADDRQLGVAHTIREQPARAWDTHDLTDDESAGLALAASRVTADPSTDMASFRMEARAAFDGLRDSTRAKLRNLADGTSVRPELYVRNLPVVPLPLTPTVGQLALTKNNVSEFIQIAFSIPFGLPISYADQREGRLFHDIYPTARNAEVVSSQSSKAHLGFHTEMFFHPEPPDFLFLHCLRPDPAGLAETGVAALADIMSLLTADEIVELSKPHFALDLARLHGIYRHDGRAITEDDPRPVLAVTPEAGTSQECGRFRFEPGLTTPTTPAAAAAMQAADDAAEKAVVAGKLESGTMLMVDNRRTVHSRSPFIANYDGTDRWLRRVMLGSYDTGPSNDISSDISSDVTGDKPGDVGYFIRNDLELCKAWQDDGAHIAPIPYVARGGVA